MPKALEMPRFFGYLGPVLDHLVDLLDADRISFIPGGENPGILEATVI